MKNTWQEITITRGLRLNGLIRLRPGHTLEAAPRLVEALFAAGAARPADAPAKAPANGGPPCRN